MKVICPKCHYENQASGTRIVCGRCATLIEVQLSPERGGRVGAEDPPEQRQTTRLRRGVPGEPRREGRSTRDPYATSIGGDFGDVLDLTPARSEGQASGDSGFERQTDPLTGDLWRGSGEGSEEGRNGRSEIDRSMSDPTSDPSLPLTAASEIGDTPAAWTERENRPFEPGSERETRDYFEPPDLVGANWPLMTENGPTGSLEEGEVSSSGRDELSGGRQGMFLRFLLGAVVFAGLIGGAYFFLGDLIRSRQEGADPPSTGEAARTTQAVNGASSRPETNPPAPTIDPPQKEGTVGPSGSSAQSGPKQERAESSAVDIPPMTGRASSAEPVKPAPIAPPKSPSASGPWTIQVAAYADEAQANARRASLQSRGMTARVVRADLPGKGTWYRVQVGDFPTREAGMVFGRDLRAKGVVSDFLVSSTRP
jgi:cell division septation protein DedD